MTFNLLSPTYLSDKLEPISLWLTIGFIGALVINLLVTLFLNKQNIVKVAKSSVLSLLFYSLVLGILLLVAEIIKKYDSAYLEENWVNKDIVNPDNEGIYLLDIRDIKKYLHNLMKSRSKTQDLEQGTENLKSRMLARLSQLFKGVKTND